MNVLNIPIPPLAPRLPGRYVLDTNVVLDLFHWGNVDAAPIMTALACGLITGLADERTLAELQRVLAYPKLKLTPEMMAERYALYEARVAQVPMGEAPPLPRCKDRDDQMFLELAARAGADGLVSKDRALLKLRGRSKLGFMILPPKTLSTAIRQQLAPEAGLACDHGRPPPGA